jgi:NADH-quinone oxidoreductase subunit L
MPVTGVTFIVGALALAGVYPLSGFFAKDEILEVASNSGNELLFVLGVLGALISALYIGRLVFLTFFGRARSEEAEHAHESPAILTIPLVLLALGAGGASLLDLTIHGALSTFMEPVVGPTPEGAAGLSYAAIVAISSLMVAIGLFTTWFVYGSGKIDWLALRVRMQPAQRVLEHGWYVDNYYSALLVTPGKAVAAWLAYVFDARIIDGIVNGIGAGFRALARSGRRLQTGLVRTYALAFLAGAIGLLVYVGFRL